MADLQDKQKDASPYHPPLMKEPAGDALKDGYNDFLGSIKRKIVNAAKQVFDSNFGMGMLLTGLAVVAVMALVPGAMAAAGGLAVAGLPVNAEQGIAAGITEAIRFLSPFSQAGGYNLMGLATLTAGGFGGRYILPKLFHEQPALSVEEAKKLAKSYEGARENQPTVTPEPEKPAPSTEVADNAVSTQWTDYTNARDFSRGMARG